MEFLNIYGQIISQIDWYTYQAKSNITVSTRWTIVRTKEFHRFITFFSWSFPKNVCLVAVDSGNVPKQQPLTGMDRVSCEVNSIGATGAKPPLLARTTICIGTRTVQPA